MRRIGLAVLAVASTMLGAGAAEARQDTFGCEGQIYDGANRSFRDFGETFVIDYDERTVRGGLIPRISYQINGSVVHFAWNSIGRDGYPTGVIGDYDRTSGTLHYTFFRDNDPQNIILTVWENCTPNPQF
ncbi:MAG: hypothetical protein ACWA6X_00565 [Bauldia sp.]